MPTVIGYAPWVQTGGGCIVSIITGTSHATINTETTHAHGLGVLPRCYLILPRGTGVVYESKACDQTNIYVKSTVTVTPFTAVVWQ